MHGRLRVKTTKEKELEQKIKDREKAYHFKHLSDQLFAFRESIKNDQCLEESLKLSAEVLLVNPDFYTAWNIRKETLLALSRKIEQQTLDEHEKHDTETSDRENDGNSDDDDRKNDRVAAFWREEQNFTIQCLKLNEKSYSVWQHRIWVLSNMPKSEYKNELKLCHMFLQKDERNFHCWNYRSYISDLAGIDLQEEMKFTTDMIQSNFSNFSAWHRRHKLFLKTILLPENERPECCDINLKWDSEYKMTLGALFTDPSDQSPWKYHNWLALSYYNKLNNSHRDILRQLAELEPGNSWVAKGLDIIEKQINSDNE